MYLTYAGTALQSCCSSRLNEMQRFGVFNRHLDSTAEKLSRFAGISVETAKESLEASISGVEREIENNYHNYRQSEPFHYQNAGGYHQTRVNGRDSSDDHIRNTVDYVNGHPVQVEKVLENWVDQAQIWLACRREIEDETTQLREAMAASLAEAESSRQRQKEEDEASRDLYDIAELQAFGAMTVAEEPGGEGGGEENDSSNEKSEAVGFASLSMATASEGHPVLVEGPRFQKRKRGGEPISFNSFFERQAVFNHGHGLVGGIGCEIGCEGETLRARGTEKLKRRVGEKGENGKTSLKGKDPSTELWRCDPNQAIGTSFTTSSSSPKGASTLVPLSVWPSSSRLVREERSIFNPRAQTKPQPQPSRKAGPIALRGLSRIEAMTRFLEEEEDESRKDKSESEMSDNEKSENKRLRAMDSNVNGFIWGSNAIRREEQNHCSMATKNLGQNSCYMNNWQDFLPRLRNDDEDDEDDEDYEDYEDGEDDEDDESDDEEDYDSEDEIDSEDFTSKGDGDDKDCDDNDDRNYRNNDGAVKDDANEDTDSSNTAYVPRHPNRTEIRRAPRTKLTAVRSGTPVGIPYMPYITETMYDRIDSGSDNKANSRKPARRSSRNRTIENGNEAKRVPNGKPFSVFNRGFEEETFSTARPKRISSMYDNPSICHPFIASATQTLIATPFPPPPSSSPLLPSPFPPSTLTIPKPKSPKSSPSLHTHTPPSLSRKRNSKVEPWEAADELKRWIRCGIASSSAVRLAAYEDEMTFRIHGARMPHINENDARSVIHQLPRVITLHVLRLRRILKEATGFETLKSEGEGGHEKGGAVPPPHSPNLKSSSGFGGFLVGVSTYACPAALLGSESKYAALLHKEWGAKGFGGGKTEEQWIEMEGKGKRKGRMGRGGSKAKEGGEGGRDSARHSDLSSSSLDPATNLSEILKNILNFESKCRKWYPASGSEFYFESKGREIARECLSKLPRFFACRSGQEERGRGRGALRAEGEEAENEMRGNEEGRNKEGRNKETQTERRGGIVETLTKANVHVKTTGSTKKRGSSNKKGSTVIEAGIKKPQRKGEISDKIQENAMTLQDPIVRDDQGKVHWCLTPLMDPVSKCRFCSVGALSPSTSPYPHGSSLDPSDFRMGHQTSSNPFYSAQNTSHTPFSLARMDLPPCPSPSDAISPPTSCTPNLDKANVTAAFHPKLLPYNLDANTDPVSEIRLPCHRCQLGIFSMTAFYDAIDRGALGLFRFKCQEFLDEIQRVVYGTVGAVPSLFLVHRTSQPSLNHQNHYNPQHRCQDKSLAPFNHIAHPSDDSLNRKNETDDVDTRCINNSNEISSDFKNKGDKNLSSNDGRKSSARSGEDEDTDDVEEVLDLETTDKNKSGSQIINVDELDDMEVIELLD